MTDSDSCDDRIDSVLDAAPVTFIRSSDLRKRAAAVEALTALEGECLPALELRARQELADFGPQSAERLAIVLDAMADRGDDVVPYALEALDAPGYAEREPFVALLEWRGGDAVVAPLSATLGRYDADSDPEGFLRRRILQALLKLGSRDAAPAILAAGADPETEQVREQAVATLRQLDARETAPALLERLEHERSPVVAAELARCLGDWSHRPAIPILERLAAGALGDDGELQAAVQGALTQLR